MDSLSLFGSQTRLRRLGVRLRISEVSSECVFNEDKAKFSIVM